MIKFQSLVGFATTGLLAVGLFFSTPSSVLAQSIDLTQYIAGPNFQEHDLSTGEHISFTSEGGSGPGSPVRMYKGGNYEQFFLGNGIFRREDTSWAPLPGFGDALCSNGNRAIYTLDPGCNHYSSGQSVTNDGAKWAPNNADVGSTWNTQTHQIVTVDSQALANSGQRAYCPLKNLSGYEYPSACNQSGGLHLEQYYPAGSFTFCTGVTNPEDLIKISGVSGPGTGDTFYFMKGWGLVGFEAPGFEAGLMLPGADPSKCQNNLIAACQTQRDDEPHSLRPYPACPWDPSGQGAALLCGNSVTIAGDEIKVTMDQGVCGTPNPNGKTTCQYSFSGLSADVTLNLSEAELPIVGNTEDVINRREAFDGGKNEIKDLTKVNEYVSWYLNGVLYRAEYQPLYVDAENQVKKFSWENSVDRLINLSGPLNKLLPREIQDRTRINTIDRAGEEQHNQFAACTHGFTVSVPFFGDISAGIPAQCYHNPFWNFGIDFHRLEQWDNKKPPIKQPDQSYQDYYIAYQNWRGKTCIPIPIPGIDKKILICFNDPTKPDYWANLFPYIPYSSTEDRVGQAELTVPASSLGDVNITNARFNGKPLPLYYSHLEETAGLATLLQSTYSSRGISDSIPNDIKPPEIGSQCTILNTRSNPGDKLLPEEAKEKIIQGTLSYDVNFSCDFENVAIPSPCIKRPTVTLDLSNLVPKVGTVWAKLVAGESAFFRRIYPKTGPNTPIEEIESIPGSTQFSPTTNKSIVGNPNQLHIPYVGSLLEYPLKAVQKALRPKDFGSTIVTGTSPDECKALAYDLPYHQTTIEPKTKQQIYDLVKDRFPGNQILTYYDLVVRRARERGYNPAFTLAVWLEESGASDYQQFGNNIYDFGCGQSVTGNVPGQLECFLNLYDNWSTGGDYDSLVKDCREGGDHPNFEDFMLFFAEGICTTVQKQNRQFCGNHVNFPDKIKHFYDITVQ